MRFLQEYSAFCFGKSKRISTEKSKTLGKMSDNKEYFQKMVKNGFSMRNGGKLCIIDNEIYINLQNIKKNKVSVYNPLQLSTKKKTEKC